MQTIAENSLQMRLPQTLGRYELQELIGSGANGSVYRARDSHLQRDTAIKILHSDMRRDSTARQRLKEEAEVLARVQHPCIASVYDFDSADGFDFLVTEYVAGMSLGEKIATGPISVKEIFELAIQLVEALAAAHEHGIVHCDIKPSNLRVTPNGRLKLLDFGLATLRRDASVDETDELDSCVGGTALYMAPERLLGTPPDPRSDVYSTGCVLYELSTGQVPFSATTIAGLGDAVLHQALTPVRTLNPEVPGSLDRIITRCLEKRPERRFGSARDLLNELHRASAWVPEAHTIAVLYFENLNQSAEDEYFRNGVTEDITTELAKIRDLRILSRSAVLPYRNKPVTPSYVGQQLGATFVLEGSVRRSGERLRITAHLVETATGHARWAERYDCEFKDIFEIQDQIAQSIARELRIVLTEGEQHAIREIPTHDVRAYDLYLRGRHFFHQFRRKGLDFAREMFTRAIEIDPNYARAYAGIADCCSFLYMFWDSTSEHLDRADIASRKALELDSNLAEAHTSRGLTASLKREFAEAQRSFDAALRLNPKLFEPYYFSGRNAYSQGEFEQAVRWFDEAARACPEDYQAAMLKASALRGLGRAREAETAYKTGLAAISRHLDIYPGDARALYFGANALSQLSDKDRAISWAKKALDLEPHEYMVLYNVACVFALVGEQERAIDCLERSITRGLGLREWMMHDPDLASLRGNPRFEGLIGLLEH